MKKKNRVFVYTPFITYDNCGVRYWYAQLQKYLSMVNNQLYKQIVTIVYINMMSPSKIKTKITYIIDKKDQGLLTYTAVGSAKYSKQIA